jgi:integrase
MKIEAQNKSKILPFGKLSSVPKTSVAKYDPDRQLSALFIRYQTEVSPKKRGMRWEILRLEKLARDYPEFISLKVSEVSAPDLVALRDNRLTQVQGSSVRREMTLLSHLFNIAAKEWHWIIESPIKGISRPAENFHRERLFVDDELDRLLNALNYSQTNLPTNATQRIGHIVLFAIETAMRAGEICRMDWSHVYLNARYVQVNITKNGKPRKVPLSPNAISILVKLFPLKSSFKGKVFGVSTASLDALFRKARKKAKIDNLHFHDTRHEAITRLSKKLKLPALMKAVGLTDPRILMVYYNESIEDIAKELAK